MIEWWEGRETDVPVAPDATAAPEPDWKGRAEEVLEEAKNA